MRHLSLVTFFLFLSANVSFACSCENVPSFCETVVLTEQNERGLVFIGEYVESLPWESGTNAKKFKIIEILSGEIILADSPFVNDNEFKNTEDEVWVLSGSGATCLYEMETAGKAIFSCAYGEWFGYHPSICSNNYLAIDENMNVYGTLYDNSNWESASIEELVDVIKNDACVSSTDDFTASFKRGLVLRNTIITNEISFDLYKISIEDLEVELYNAQGKLVISKKVETALNNSISTNKLSYGIYFLSFVKDRNRYTVRIVKQ